MIAAKADTVIGHKEVMALLARTAKSTVKASKDALSKSIAAEVLWSDGDTLAITVLGTTVMPDLEDWAPEDPAQWAMVHVFVSGSGDANPLAQIQQRNHSGSFSRKIKTHREKWQPVGLPLICLPPSRVV